jgi:RNA polymerase sigma factor (sigma-70 family)
MAYARQTTESATNPTFEEALRAARLGEQWAFRELWARWAREIEGFLRARGHRDPGDAANEVFLRAFRALERFEGDEAAFRAWLFTITRNLIIDAHRHEANRPQLCLVAHPADGRTAPSAEQDALDGLDDRVTEILSVLTDEQREVLLLRVLGGFDSNEVAALTARRPGAVRALQRRALQRLRRHHPDIATSGIFEDRP